MPPDSKRDEPSLYNPSIKTSLQPTLVNTHANTILYLSTSRSLSPKKSGGSIEISRRRGYGILSSSSCGVTTVVPRMFRAELLVDMSINIVGRWPERTRPECVSLVAGIIALRNGRLSEQWKGRMEYHTLSILSEILGNDWRKSHQGETRLPAGGGRPESQTTCRKARARPPPPMWLCLTERCAASGGGERRKGSGVIILIIWDKAWKCAAVRTHC